MTDNQEEKLLINQQMLHNFLELCQKDDLVELTKLYKMRIPGFIDKKVQSAPYVLLKTHVTKKIKQKINPEFVLKMFTAPIIKRYEKLSEQEFINRIKLEQEVSNAKVMAMFCIIYNSIYKEYEETISENIRAGKPFYTDVIVESFTDWMTALSNLFMEQHDNHLRHLMEDHPLKDEWDAYFSSDKSLKEKLIEHPPEVFKGYYIKSLVDYEKEYKKWKAKEREALLILALQDMAYLSYFLQENHEEIFEKQEKQNEKLKVLASQLEKKNQNIKDLKKKVKEQEIELQDVWREVEEQEKKNKELEKELSNLRNTLEEEQQQTTKLKKNLNEVRVKFDLIEKSIQNHKEEESDFTLFSEKLLLVSSAEDQVFKHFLREDQFIKIKNQKDFEATLDQLENPDESIVFIDTDGVNSKLLFKLERKIKSKSITYRLVSGGPKKVIQKIGFYLEGDILNEVNETSQS